MIPGTRFKEVTRSSNGTNASQIRFYNSRMRDKKVTSTRYGYDAGFKYVRAIANFEAGPGHLFDQENCAPLHLEFPEGLEHCPHQIGREPKRWLVEYQEPRIADQGPGDGDHLLFPAAEQTGRLLSSLADPRK